MKACAEYIIAIILIPYLLDMVKQDGGLIVLRVLAATRSLDISIRTRTFLLFCASGHAFVVRVIVVMLQASSLPSCFYLCLSENKTLKARPSPIQGSTPWSENIERSSIYSKCINWNLSGHSPPCNPCSTQPKHKHFARKRIHACQQNVWSEGQAIYVRKQCETKTQIIRLCSQETCKNWNDASWKGRPRAAFRKMKRS